MSPLSANDLYRIFHTIDKNGDGLVSVEDLNWLLATLGVSFDISELEEGVGKPSLDLNDFMNFYQSLSRETEDDEKEKEGVIQDLAKAFEVFDINGDGFISSEELQCVLDRLGLWDERNGKDCGMMIRMFDTNRDGVLDFEEFKNMMLKA